MKIIPRNNLVLVRPMDAREQRTASGVVIPADRSQEFEIAEIVAIGRGVVDQGHTRTEDLRPGQIVMVRARQSMGPRGGIVERYVSLARGLGPDASKVRLLDESDVFCIIHPDPADAATKAAADAADAADPDARPVPAEGDVKTALQRELDAIRRGTIVLRGPETSDGDPLDSI